MSRVNNTSFYLNAFKKYGVSPKGLNWINEYSQNVRFGIILDLIGKNLTRTTTVVDAGCGFGDFYLFLKKRNIEVEYIGYDVLEEFIEVAKKRTKQKCYKRDIVSDELEYADFYVASGSLNILTKFETMLFIQRCYEHSKKGFVFNLLKSSNISSLFNICDKQEIIDFGKEIGAKVYIKDGYLPEDFTLFFQKNNQD